MEQRKDGSFVMPKSPCPYCGTMMTAGSPIPEEKAPREPRPGDMTLCIECTGTLVYGPNFELQKPTAEDIASWDPEDREIIRRAAWAIKMAKEHGAPTTAKLAKHIHDREVKQGPLMKPPIVYAIIAQGGKWYIGGYQDLGPQFEPISFVSKSTNTITVELVEELRALNPLRPLMHVPDDIDIEGRYHMLRRDGNQFLRLSPEQAAYVKDRAVTPIAVWGKDEHVDYQVDDAPIRVHGPKEGA